MHDAQQVQAAGRSLLPGRLDRRASQRRLPLVQPRRATADQRHAANQRADEPIDEAISRQIATGDAVRPAPATRQHPAHGIAAVVAAPDEGRPLPLARHQRRCRGQALRIQPGQPPRAARGEWIRNHPGIDAIAIGLASHPMHGVPSGIHGSSSAHNDIRRQMPVECHSQPGWIPGPTQVDMCQLGMGMYASIRPRRANRLSPGLAYTSARRIQLAGHGTPVGLTPPAGEAGPIVGQLQGVAGHDGTLFRPAATPHTAAVPEPVLYIAGDVHHDGTDPGFGLWLDRLAAREPARLVILGDLVEWWVDTAGSAQRHEPILGRLRRLRAAGWRIDVIRGNREMAAGRSFEIASGCRLRWPRLDLDLGPLRLRIVHGDRLVHDPGYRAWAAVCRSFPFRLWQNLHPARVQELIATALRRNSRGNRPYDPDRPRRIFIDPRKVQAAARGVDVLIAGHVHEAWRRRIGGVDLILAGHWPHGVGHWVEGFADGRLERRNDRLV
jgi:UDP-2,3-diacylglucosamine pyrophosphatase LpxH